MVFVLVQGFNIEFQFVYDRLFELLEAVAEGKPLPADCQAIMDAEAPAAAGYSTCLQLFSLGLGHQ